MAVSPEIQDLVDNPIETLHVELKRWLDLTLMCVSEWINTCAGFHWVTTHLLTTDNTCPG